MGILPFEKRLKSHYSRLSLTTLTPGKGFVLKPDILREECYHYSIDTRTHIAGIHPKHMNIRVRQLLDFTFLTTFSINCCKDGVTA